ncbi:hypothetical protein F66182_347 [Fusarium sp. NRRL 66182]|nr:hypothetical protein F66182_347 [Fusarium sp. NRRL 66182]
MTNQKNASAASLRILKGARFNMDHVKPGSVRYRALILSSLPGHQSLFVYGRQVYAGQDSVPCCETCRESAHQSLAFLKQETSSSGPLPIIPPDKPADQLNLTWPSTVPWTTEVEVHQAAIHEAAGLRAAPERTASTTAHEPAKSSASDSPSYIYDALNHGQFRLVCLEPDRQDTPSTAVHFELETHELGQCPDYETVSYSWGGEDGNQRLCRPIYIGEFWDILLQTQNCFSMLQYLKPRRGCRMVWVDAICINQSDIDERSQQVQQMGNIYSQCSQVVLWLGDDIVKPVPGTYPSRHPLQDLAMEHRTSNLEEHIGLRYILRRRYFSRVWVIQELILAPRVMMPVANIIFYADARTSRDLPTSMPTSWSWEDTQAPWMQHMTQKSVQATGLFDVVSLLSKSQASDPRDHVFGILGLLPTFSGLGTLQPNYSLSLQDVFFGFIAHSVFVDGKHFLLHKACGVDSTAGVPSWMPDHRKAGAWNHVLSKDANSFSWFTVHRDVNESGKDATLETHFKPDQTPSISETVDCIGIGYESEYPSYPRTASRNTNSTWTNRFIKPLDARIHYNTGHLSLNLRRIMAIDEAPVAANLRAMQGCRIPIKTKGSLVNPSVYLVGSSSLHTIVRAGDEIWSLERHNTPSVMLVLRQTGERQTFSLVTTGRHLFCVFRLPKTQLYLDFYVPFLSTNKMQHHKLEEYLWIRQLSCLESRTLDNTRSGETWYDADMGKVLDVVFLDRDHAWALFDRNDISPQILLSFATRAFEEDGSETPRLPKRWKDLYVSCLKSQRQPYLDDVYCYVKPRDDDDDDERLTKAMKKAWTATSQGAHRVRRRRLDDIERDLARIISSPRIYAYLRTCLSLRRRVHKDYAVGDVELLTLEVEQDGRDSSGWAGLLRDQGFYKDMANGNSFSAGFYDEFCMDFGLDGYARQDLEARETTYTIFCPDLDDTYPPECDLSLEFPFVLVEGPETVRFHGTHTSRLTADLECKLKGKTLATCSGYSSFCKGYNDGVHTGPTEVTWTSTFTGDEVEWGVLTMAELPSDPQVFTAATSTPGDATDFVSMPIETNSDSAGPSLRTNAREAAFLTACCTLALGWLW